MAEESPITRDLRAMQSGSEEAERRVFDLVYRELHEMAERQLAGERRGHTLQATALVNEAYLKLAAQDSADWAGRDQFLAVASIVMRRVLIDHARSRAAQKRGAGAAPARLIVDVVDGAAERGVDLVEVHEALERFERIDPRAARVVEMRFFGGLPMEKIAALIGVSKETVKRDWVMARGWLRTELGESGERDDDAGR